VRPLRDQLQREAASLYAFVETVSRTCAPPSQAVSYSESSTKFFRQISLLAERTKQHIANFEQHADDNAEEFVESRTELSTLRSAWRELHQFIKPSADADTLNQPTALIVVLVNRLRELPRFGSTDFVIFHTDSFDYAQANPQATEEIVAQLARIVDADQIPTDLGLIGIPNSQGNALFLNCLLAHEIGEYAYAKRRDIEAILAGEAEAALRNHMGKEFTAKPLVEQTFMRTTVLQWAKEIFCDLFAVRLIGPSYSFAYIELFDLPNLLSKDGTLAVGGNLKPPIRMYPTHPSHPFRVKEQVELLKEEGWWDLINNFDSRQCTVLKALLELSPNTFLEAERAAGGNRMAFLKALLDVRPEVKKKVVEVTNGIDSRLNEYIELRKPIAEYLGNGIVPSTLIVREPSSELRQVHPTPITLLNASYQFYLEGVEDLMDRIEGQDLSSAHDRAVWMRKIENWTAKALEDVALLRGLEQ
jgi:hypothetical protein